jgi:hypothetical protein
MRISSRRATQLTRCRWCGVCDSTRCPVSAARTAISAVSAVADLADQDDVGVVAEHGPKAVRRTRGRPRRGPGSGRLPSSWYSTGSSIVTILRPSLVGVGERGVERGGFAGAGGAGDQDEALGEQDQFPHGLLLLGVHAQLGEVEEEGVAAEDPQADGFAVLGGDDRGAEIVILGLRLQGDTAVLRQPAFGDVRFPAMILRRETIAAWRSRRPGRDRGRPAARRRCGTAGGWRRSRVRGGCPWRAGGWRRRPPGRRSRRWWPPPRRWRG